ncbi:MAG: HU family DNA-binding protein [Planctomycetota bacterium]|jgi:DNA-binding protein HU-beta
MAETYKDSAKLKKPKSTDKSFTKTQLIAHLTEVVNEAELGAALNKKQVAALLEELANVSYAFAPVGATLPGLGKLLIKKTPARPARTGRNPATGEEIQIAKKPAGKKLAFRINKAAKEGCGLA